MKGHVQPLGPDKFRLFVDAGIDSTTGKRRQVTRTVRGSRKDADTALARLVTEVNDGRHGGTRGLTLSQLLEAYLDHKSLSVEQSTADSYRQQLVYIPARLLAMPIGKVDVTELERLYAHLCRRGSIRSGAGLSPRTVRKIHAVIHGAYELARRRGWVAVNPAADAEVPTARRRQPTPAPMGAITELFRAAADIHHALPLYLQLSLCVGGRRGEVHGVRWSGVDFERSTVHIIENVVRAGGEWVVKPYTKTGGDRRVFVDPDTLARLRALHDLAFSYALACRVALPSTAFVFSDSAVGDRPWNPRTTLDRFQRACAAAGLPTTTRLHDLRSLMATYLIDQGVPLPVVAARLGHDRNSTTLDIYTGRVAASDALAAEVMGRLFDGTS